MQYLFMSVGVEIFIMKKKEKKKMKMLRRFLMNWMLPKMKVREVGLKSINGKIKERKNTQKKVKKMKL